MNYEDYVYTVLSRRYAVRQRWKEVNEGKLVRKESPLIDVEQMVSDTVPLMTEDEYKEHQAYSRFYERERAKHSTYDEVHTFTEGDTKRTLGLLQIIDAKIKQAWMDKRRSEALDELVKLDQEYGLL